MARDLRQTAPLDWNPRLGRYSRVRQDGIPVFRGHVALSILRSKRSPPCRCSPLVHLFG